MDDDDDDESDLPSIKHEASDVRTAEMLPKSETLSVSQNVQSAIPIVIAPQVDNSMTANSNIQLKTEKTDNNSNSVGDDNVVHDKSNGAKLVDEMLSAQGVVKVEPINSSSSLEVSIKSETTEPLTKSSA